MRIKSPAAWAGLALGAVQMLIAGVLSLVWMVGWYPAIMAPELINVLRDSGIAIAVIVLLSTLAMVASCTVRGGTLPFAGVIAAEAFLMVRLDANRGWWENFVILAVITAIVIIVDLVSPTPQPRPRMQPFPAYPPRPMPPGYRPAPQNWPPQPNQFRQPPPPGYHQPPRAPNQPPRPDNSAPPY